MMQALKLWHDYTREDVHAIFSPNTKFTPQAGTWGLQGMVRVPARFGDWVFFVTFGQEQGEHVFDESITTQGVLSWQSQPAQRLADATINELIRHNETTNNIHLFLRTNRRRDYTYFGPLGYLLHDSSRERPVHFQWQLLDWPAPAEVLTRIGLKLIEAPNISQAIERREEAPGLTVLGVPPPINPRQGVPTHTFRTRKAPDYAARDARNRTLGLRGELLVLEHEKRQLIQVGRSDLAGLIVHTSVVEGDAAGYDIRSFEPDGRPRYIEVKTTEGDATTGFFLSPNELAFSSANAEHYVLYRLYQFDEQKNSALSFLLHGDVGTQLQLIPTAYRATLQGNDST